MLKITQSRKEISLTKKVGTSDPFRNKSAHAEISKAIMERGYDCASIIMVQEHLSDRVVNDPKHCKITRTIEYSEFEEIVHREAERHYPALEVVLEIMKTRFPDRVTNQENGNATCHKVYRNDLEKQIWRAYDLMHFAKIYWDMRVAIETDIKEEGVSLSPVERQKRVWDEMFSLMLPQVHTHRERIIPLCEPFSFWDERNRWQQWFLVDKGDRVDYAIGGSCSSGFREKHGLYAHAFSMLSQKGYEIPTHIFELTSDNELKWLRTYDCFKVVDRELTGNYRVDWDKTKSLFKNRLVSVSNGNFSEVRPS